MRFCNKSAEAMRNDFPDILIADRLGGRNYGRSGGDYKFARIKKARQEAMERNPRRTLLDFGVGEPDEGADSLITGRLMRECARKENRLYADNGIDEFRDACLSYLERVYAVTGLERKNILHGIGSKQILALLPHGFINRGDISLVTVPGYPVLGTHTAYLGGRVYPCPLTEENGFFPDLKSIPRRIRKKAKLFYINYPNNPTGRRGTEEFYRRIIDFAWENDILIVQDGAYAALDYGEAPLSILRIDGALERTVEIHSLSKAFNMTGWRMAFIAGSARAVEVYGTVKDNTDSGQFRAVQLSACEALRHPELTVGYKGKYRRRLDLLVEVLRKCGFGAERPGGTFYCYVPAPGGTGKGDIFRNASEAAEFLIREGSIVTVPWDEAGSFLRFSVTYEAENQAGEREVMAELERRLKAMDLRF